MATNTETDHVLFLNGNEKTGKRKIHFYTNWWEQSYSHQRYICRIIEQRFFYKITIILLILDCLLVMSQTILDFTKVKSECNETKNWFIAKHKHEIEITMKILHYLSLSILTLFVIELLIKLYVFGKDFWNINKRKMEYFDGFIVLYSFFIDIYFLVNEKHYFMEYKFHMMTSIRIWRFVRIINCVALCIINEERKKKDNLNRQYINSIEELIDLLKYKSDDTFHQCQIYFDELNETNRQMTSTIAITKFYEQIKALQSSLH